MVDIVLPNGATIRNVPDGITKEQVRQKAIAVGLATEADFGAPAAVRENLDAVNADVGPMEAFAIGAGRGLVSLARGVGAMDAEHPLVTQAYRGLSEDRSVATTAGEITGQAAPFMLPGIGAAAIPSTAVRVAGASALGAAEGGIVSRGTGGGVNEIAGAALFGGALGGTAEAILPLLNRVGGSYVRRALGRSPRGPLFDKAGNPSPELVEAMQKLNVGLQDLSNEATFALERQSAGINPAEAVRAARFETLGIPSTQGNITQDFGQQAVEERLASMASGAAGEPLRQIQLNQSEAFTQGINSLVDSLGVPSSLGDDMKAALTGRMDGIKSRKNALYKEFAEKSQQAASLPIITDEIAGALPTEAELRRIARINGNNVDAVKSLLIEFGVDKAPESVEPFLKSGGKIIPLNLSNFDEFRQALNQLRDDQSSGGRATNFIIGKIQSALDSEADKVEQALLDAGTTDSAMIEPLRQARSLVTKLKTEFSPQSIVGRMIGAKQDGVTPIIEASKAYDAVMGKSQPIEYLERTIDSLSGSPKGKVAIGAMQAETVLRALDSALKAPSRKTSGIQTVGYPQFVKALQLVGEDKLSVLFKDNPRALKQLTMFRDAAQDLTVDARTTPKGSAPVILDAINRISRTPGIAPFVDAIKYIALAGADERSVRSAMNARPQIRRTITQIQNDYPALASALGVATISQNEDEK